MQHAVIVLIGAAAGIVTGLIGASGGMVVVPALAILGYSTANAIGASLFIDMIASLVVAWTYYQSKNLNFKQSIWIAVGAVAGAQIGSLLSLSIPDVGLSGSFSVFLLLTAVIFWIRGVHAPVPSERKKPEEKESFFVHLMRAHIVVSGLILGLLVGIMSGIIGAGGGVMILLILVFLLQFSMHEGIGTSTLIMAFTAGSGAIGHAMSGNLPMVAAIWGSVGTLIGGRIAARFANKISEKVLSKVIAGLFVGLAVAMFIMRKN
jgi:uncharacterized membrane protein YfcA